MEKRLFLALLVAVSMVVGAQADYDTAGADYAARQAFRDSGNARRAAPATTKQTVIKKAQASDVKQLPAKPANANEMQQKTLRTNRFNF